MYKIAVLVGSLRRDSINLKFAKALAKLGGNRFDFRFVELGDLPIYNEDLWENPPPSVLRLKKDVDAADAVLFVTPEYNRSIPAVVKNAIDWGSEALGPEFLGGQARIDRPVSRRAISAPPWHRRICAISWGTPTSSCSASQKSFS